MEANSEQGFIPLKITTLGSFDLQLGNQSLLRDTGRSYKLLELFKYFLSFKEKKILPETIIDIFWPEADYQSPKNALRTNVFRLRKLMETILTEYGGEKDYLTINFTNGYYTLDLSEQVVLDVQQFEDILNEANRIREIAPLKAIELYKQAIGLYRGDYLAENGYSEWLVPLRNHYNRLYIQSLLRLVELLKEREEHDQILDVCERGLSIEPLEEVLHIYFIEALLKLGQMKHALSHYEYVTSYFYRELGVKPSAVMRNLYKKIQAHNEEKGEMTLSQIKIRLEEENISGALFCDLDYFKFIYNLELRRSTRLPTTNYLGLLTLISKGTGVASQQKIKEIMGSLRQLLYASLRKGDLFSFWNDTQMVFILFNITEDGLGKIEERIEKNFHQQGKADIFTLELSFGPIITK